jgi:hypothetical protein
MADCKEVYKVVKGEVTATTTLMETLSQACLDAVGSKARDQWVRATHEDVGGAEGLYIQVKECDENRANLLEILLCQRRLRPIPRLLLSTKISVISFIN